MANFTPLIARLRHNMITREQIEARLVQLEAEQKQTLASLEQLQANAHAYAGAIEDCKYWLALLFESKE
jgi:hypothetical protein